jgi:hypothetical protein
VGPGDAVVVLPDVFLHGAGLFDRELDDEHILVLFSGDREEIVNVRDLELLDVWIEKQPDLASTLLRDRLRD